MPIDIVGGEGVTVNREVFYPSGGPSSSRYVIDFDVNRIVDRIIHRLRECLPEELQWLARETSILDATACAVLADWVQENGQEEAGAAIRKMAVEDGDILVLTSRSAMSPEARAEARNNLTALLRQAGKPRTVVVIIDDGIILENILVRGRHESA